MTAHPPLRFCAALFPRLMLAWLLAVAGHGSLGRQRGDTAGHGSIGEVAADVAVNKTARAILRRISTKLTGTVRP